jgi:hypothetical protein
MKLWTVLFFLASTAIGYGAIYIYRGSAGLNAVYVDRWGERWRVPSNGWVTRITNQCIEMIPRFSTDFEMVDPDFDLEDQYYLTCSGLYVVFCGLIGILFLVGVAIFFIARYVCGCCGGKRLPRRGYSRDDVSCTRLLIVVLSFLLEGVLLYGYFANSDFDISLGKLVKTFQGVGAKLDSDVHRIMDALPKNNTGNEIYDRFQYDFNLDLDFSGRYAVEQTNVMKSMTDGFESGRMALIILTLIIATFGCSVGIAAGSLNRGWPVMVMVGLNTLAIGMIFFSAGFHFTGSKIVYEYCDAIDWYLEYPDEVIPQRLQYFVPCVASPVFPYIQDYFVIHSVLYAEQFHNRLMQTSLYQDTSNDYRYSPAQWFNITDPFYEERIAEITPEADQQEIESMYRNITSFVNILLLIDDSQHCKFTKNEMKEEHFLFCVYLKDNLDMLTLTQCAGAILLVLIVLTGIPAIRKFEWAGNANLGGVLNAGRGPNAKGARAKRKA